jgi:hypothetical protein
MHAIGAISGDIGDFRGIFIINLKQGAILAQVSGNLA